MLERNCAESREKIVSGPAAAGSVSDFLATVLNAQDELSAEALGEQVAE